MIQSFLSSLIVLAFNDSVNPSFTHTSGPRMIQSFLPSLTLLAFKWFCHSFLYSYPRSLNDSVIPFFSDTGMNDSVIPLFTHTSGCWTIQSFLSLLILLVFKWFSHSFLYSYFWPLNDSGIPFFTHTSGLWKIQSFLSLLIFLAFERYSHSFLYSYFWPLKDSGIPFCTHTSGLWMIQAFLSSLTLLTSEWLLNFLESLTVNYSNNPVQLRAPQLHCTHVYSAVQQHAVWTTAAHSSLMKIHSQGATWPDNTCALLQIAKRSQYHPSKQGPLASALSLTRLQLSGTNSLFLSILPVSSFKSSLKTSLFLIIII